MDDLDVIAERRKQLLMFLEESRLNQMLEQYLLDSLRAVRESRNRADKMVVAIIREGELKPYAAPQWRVLLDEIGDQVARACTRSSLAE